MIVMREAKFKPIEELFIHYLEDEAAKINADFNYARCRAYATYPPSSSPQGVGYFTMFIDCLLIQTGSDKTDNLALGIEVYDKNNKVSINADICWGHPYAKVEDEVFPEPVDATEENLGIVRKRLPELVSKLREMIRDNPNGK
jgi:hypothetical protein